MAQPRFPATPAGAGGRSGLSAWRMYFPLGRKVVGRWGSLPGVLFSGCLAVLLGSGTQHGLGVCICPHTRGRAPACGSHMRQGPCMWLHVGPQACVRLVLKAVQLPAWMGAVRPLPTASQGPCFLADAQRAFGSQQ